MFGKKTGKQKIMSDKAKQRQKFAIRDYYAKKQINDDKRKVNTIKTKNGQKPY